MSLERARGVPAVEDARAIAHGHLLVAAKMMAVVVGVVAALHRQRLLRLTRRPRRDPVHVFPTARLSSAMGASVLEVNTEHSWWTRMGTPSSSVE